MTQKRIQVASLVFLVVIFSSCQASPPKTVNEAITLMVKHGNRGRYDDAIRVAQAWIREHPDNTPRQGQVYEQLGLVYLVKASKDPARKEELTRQATEYFDKDISVHQMHDGDIELFTIGHDFEGAGDISSVNRCAYYARALKAFEDQARFIQGDNVRFDDGKAIPLAPVRQENQKSLENVKTKLEKAACR